MKQEQEAIKTGERIFREHRVKKLLGILKNVAQPEV